MIVTGRTSHLTCQLVCPVPWVYGRNENSGVWSWKTGTPCLVVPEESIEREALAGLPVTDSLRFPCCLGLQVRAAGQGGEAGEDAREEEEAQCGQGPQMAAQSQEDTGRRVLKILSISLGKS